MTNSTALVWEAGDAITKAETFQKAADVLSDKRASTICWTRIRVCTEHVGAMQMADRVIGTALYLMQRGPVIKDGDTLGAIERERLNVRAFQNSNEFILMRAL